MRIVLDLQACQSESRFRGIGRYSMSLAKAIARQAGTNEIWIALNARFPDTIPNIRFEFEALVPKERIVTFSIPGPVAETNGQKGWRACAAEVIREHFLASLAPDIIHISTAFEGSTEDVVSSIGAFEQDAISSVTLYDLIPLVLSDKYLPTQHAKEFYFRKLESLKKSRCLLAISEFTRQDAIRLLGLSSDSVINISAAVDDSFKPRSISPEEKKILQEKYLFNRPIVLCSPGGFDERKNISNLIIAYSKLPRELRKTHQLMITSQITHNDAKIIHGFAKKQRLGKDELILSGYVPNEDLIALYNLCELFVFPSLYEGFGLPALEAMACGAPVIGSKTTSVPEVIGRADALFDPARPEAITEMMQNALTDEDFRQSLRKYGLEQSRKFSWDNSAKKALEAFEAVYQREKIEGVKTRFYDRNHSYQRLLLTLAEIKVDVIPTYDDVLSAAQAIALNRVSEEPHQLLLDISELAHRDAKSGIQRVVRNIISELLKSPMQGYQVKLVYFDGKCYRYADYYMNDSLGDRVPAMKDDVMDVAQGDIFLGLDLTAYLISKTHDFLKQLNILGVKVYFVVYDILAVQRPEWWPEYTNKVFRQWLESIAEVSTGLVCISRSVACDLMEWLRENSSKRIESLPIGYFHLGADTENSISSMGLPGDAGMVLSALSSRPSFLMVGTIEPRKGHAQTLSAFELLWEKGVDVNLVIVGKRGWLAENIMERLSNHPMLGKRLFWLEGVSDEYLKEIYLCSKAVIMASEGEGFGLPIVEAARHKIPLILRNLPVFQEVAGEYAAYFSGLDAEALATAIINWLEQNVNGKTPPSENIRFLSWKESAQSSKNLLQNPFDPNWINNWQPIHQSTLHKQQTNHS